MRVSPAVLTRLLEVCIANVNHTGVISGIKVALDRQPYVTNDTAFFLGRSPTFAGQILNDDD